MLNFKTQSVILFASKLLIFSFCISILIISSSRGGNYCTLIQYDAVNNMLVTFKSVRMVTIPLILSESRSIH